MWRDGIQSWLVFETTCWVMSPPARHFFWQRAWYYTVYSLLQPHLGLYSDACVQQATAV